MLTNAKAIINISLWHNGINVREPPKKVNTIIWNANTIICHSSWATVDL